MSPAQLRELLDAVAAGRLSTEEALRDLAELPYADLLGLQAAVHRMGDTAARDVHDDFIVFPIPPRPKT